MTVYAVQPTVSVPDEMFSVRGSDSGSERRATTKSDNPHAATRPLSIAMSLRLGGLTLRCLVTASCLCVFVVATCDGICVHLCDLRFLRAMMRWS
jgi:hypothetical protein